MLNKYQLTGLANNSNHEECLKLSSQLNPIYLLLEQINLDTFAACVNISKNNICFGEQGQRQQQHSC